MKPTDRARLTAALREHVAKIAQDLRGKMRAPGLAQTRARKLHADEQVAEDFDVWTDLLSRRAAVLWVLKSVYVRVLEDRGLLQPGRLLDPEAQQLFERLAPNLGETAFLRWAYRDLASVDGGLPELFSPQPAEVAAPSDDLSRALIAFWRHRDADSGVSWTFADERFEGELMGDLYQELDPVVKDRFALCQTPDFVRAFILDRTLTPAIETFGADAVRLLDPACGSGHFLIDGLKRLVAATAAQHPAWERGKVVAHALDRVVGMDLNDYACALARTRLVMTAAELSGVKTLAEAGQYHPHVYWADGLEQVERDDAKAPVQFGLFEKVEEKPRATLTRTEIRGALRTILVPGFHAVIANPPYHGESDPRSRRYHRERVGGRVRYSSASGRYTLATVFAERCLQLCKHQGRIGVIIANSFTNKSFGKPFVEDVLSSVDLWLVADTSGAILATSGFETPTLMLFAVKQPPSSERVRVISGKTGDTTRAVDASTGAVWTSIINNWTNAGFENEYVSVDDFPRRDLDHWPWIFATHEAAELRLRIESKAEACFGDYAQIGVACVTGEDACFILPKQVAERLRIEKARELITGDCIRDWTTDSGDHCVFPYEISLLPAMPDSIPNTISYLWRYRRALRDRKQFGTPILQKGMEWFELQELYTDKLVADSIIAFPYMGTHNHFVLDQHRRLFKNSAFVADVGRNTDPWRLLANLNSSVLGFWIRQRLSKAGGRSSGTKRQSEPWAQRLIFSAKLLKAAPICRDTDEAMTFLARKLDALGREYASLSPALILSTEWDPSSLKRTLEEAERKAARLRDMMVAMQEELDWQTYTAFGLAEKTAVIKEVEPLASEHRPFAIRMARKLEKGVGTRYWFEAAGVEPTTTVPDHYSRETRARIERRIALAETSRDVALLECPEFKRKWEPFRFQEDIFNAAFEWIASCVEETLASKAGAISISLATASLQDDPRLLALASVYQARRDVDLAGLLVEIFAAETVPNHPLHIYTDSGLTKRGAWEDVWSLQRREDLGEEVGNIPLPPDYSQGSRGKSTDFLRYEYWQLRGKLDVPKERFIAFTEVPGRSAADTLYGWAGWTPLQRLRALLAIDEELEDAGVPLADRTGVLDSAWRLLPDVAREDPAAAARLKAELQSLVGPEGPSRELLEDWKKRFPPPTARAPRGKRPTTPPDEDEAGGEEDGA